MSEDTLYLLLCYLIFGLTLTILTFRSKNRQKTLIVNLLIAGLYNGLFIYNLTVNSSGGRGLAWLVYLLFFIGMHWLINLIGIVLTFKKGSKEGFV